MTVRPSKSDRGFVVVGITGVDEHDDGACSSRLRVPARARELTPIRHPYLENTSCA